MNLSGSLGANDGTSEANAWDLATAITSHAAGQRVNFKGTLASGATSRTFATAGTETSLVHWRGYHLIPGDLDNDINTLPKPRITFAGGVITVSAGFHLFSNLDAFGASNNALFAVSSGGSPCFLDRCRIENTALNANARALAPSGITRVTRSWLKASASASGVVRVGSTTHLFGNRIIGGLNGVEGLGAYIAIGNIITGAAQDGMTFDGSTVFQAVANTIYNVGRDGIRLVTGGVNFSATVANNIISTCLGYALNNASGTNHARIVRLKNVAHAFTSGVENGFGDFPAIDWLIDPSSPFTNAAGGDFSLAAGSLARGAGFPGAYENDSNVGYMSPGAMQLAAGGGNTYSRGRLVNA